ncbi:sensor domain-containing diguanylate cyclase [Sphingomonas sanxanigenens]|uniref:diguanylate cyclase n=1 Tax=Sphingomonas sanxanigenens DSM 19645 = NX02 TaxID=1123269 RepID=W0AD53_9SPHN|nr:diguanylate cyclase [Sphingomonas sanxanigenens]AHE54996.1 hypothetical protein NX02_16590 [Sphingomonas sanxanigenens DSM 19645 = NX02]
MALQGPRNRSIAARATLLLSLVIGLIFVAAGVSVYFDIREQTLSQTLVQLDSYSGQVSALQESRFARLGAAHRNARALLLAELASGDSNENARLFNRLFPSDGRGARRSIDLLFDGGQTPFGFVRGVGAFVRAEPDMQEKSLLLAATRVAHAVGEGVRPDLKSLYFFTPDNALIMFAPDRKDQLRFYRKTAPPSLDFQGETFARISTPQANPRRETRCTPLVHILYDRTGRTWTTGCMTPVDVGGRHIGTWGTSLLLEDLLGATELDGPPGADVVLVSTEGMLIRHPRYTRQSRAGAEKLLDLTATRDPALQALWAFVQRHGSAPFVGRARGLHAYVAMRRIPTPGWYVMVMQDESVLRAAATRALIRVGITAALCLVIQAVVVALLLRRYVRQPLKRLAEQTRDLTSRIEPGPVADFDDDLGGDEVQRLAHDFAVMSTRLTEAHEGLERQVAKRTEQLREANAELARLADFDALTSLPNRRRMIRDIEARLASSDASSLYMLLLDIDFFKHVNDTYGHLAGDRLLADVAADARAVLHPDDLFGRIGGEEFMAMIEAESLGEAWERTEHLRETLAGRRRKLDGSSDVAVTVSIGIAAAFPGASFSALYATADAALYDAKRNGRNQCSFGDAVVD